MGRKIFQGTVIFVAMFCLTFTTGAAAGFKRVKQEGFPNAVQLSSVHNRKLSYPPVERNLGTPKIEESTSQPGPEQNVEEEEKLKNDLEATSAPILEESVEIIEETQMHGVPAKYEYQRSDWWYFGKFLVLVCNLIIILCYYCSPDSGEEDLESRDSSKV